MNVHMFDRREYKWENIIKKGRLEKSFFHDNDAFDVFYIKNDNSVNSCSVRL